MAKLDSFIDTVIPWIIVIVFVGIFYVKLKPAIDQIVKWFRDLFGWGKEKVSNTAEGSYQLVYH